MSVNMWSKEGKLIEVGPEGEDIYVIIRHYGEDIKLTFEPSLARDLGKALIAYGDLKEIFG